ncbi:MAG: substrate-binding domain-containing protein [Solirubrobacterales bacterium]|nr:substrate-binding domain-containing protein [Solirubrobacterales bacterium]
MKLQRFALAAISLFVLAAGAVFAGCGGDSNSGGSGSGKGGKIALLLPESKTARYETQDRPLFTKKVEGLCANCEIIYSNADQDAAKQQQQAEAALTQGAQVLVLDPVDAASAETIVKQAKAKNVPVISYDRLIDSADIDYYISFDNEKVGELQANALKDKMGDKGTIVMINGAPTDNNAKLFKAGAMGVFEASNIKIGKEYDTPDWSPDKAQSEMEQAITALGKDGFQGVYAANDGTAGGAIAAMKSAGVDSADRPTTGQDAELAAIQRIIAGTQFMTIYKAVKPEAEQAAQLAVALAQGETPDAGLITGDVDAGGAKIPSIILDPVVVNKENVNDTVVKDGFWTAEQICTSAYAADCKAAGIE